MEESSLEGNQILTKKNNLLSNPQGNLPLTIHLENEFAEAPRLFLGTMYLEDPTEDCGTTTVSNAVSLCKMRPIKYCYCLEEKVVYISLN